MMRGKTLIAVGIGAAFALPLAAQGEVDSLILAQSGGPSGASAVGTGPTGGVPRAGGPGPADASAGRPRDFTGQSVVQFSDLDQNRDGLISQTEWNAYAASASSASVGTTSTQTGVTAGPGSVSPRTAPSAATATSPSTSGHGKPK